MFYSDFDLTWDGLGDSSVYPETEFAEGQLPDEYELFKGESRAGDLIFVVPSDAKGFGRATAVHPLLSGLTYIR